MEKSKEQKSSLMQKLLEGEKYQPRSLNRGQIIEGTVVSVTSKEILVDVGAKAEGIISSREVEEALSSFQVGDKIFSYVIDPEGEAGQVILSLKRAGSIRSWQVLNEALKSKTEVKVKPTEINRGGLLVTFEGVKGFIPSSQLRSSLEEALKKDWLAVKVIELDKQTSKVVFSEKEMGPRKKVQDVGKVKEGEVYSATVTKVAPFGVFVKLGAQVEDEEIEQSSSPSEIEGLVHISEVAWEKVFDPSLFYKVGDAVTVKVLNTDKELNRVNLSIKQANADPWETAHERYTPGNKVKGVINKITPSGMVVRLEPGVEGMANLKEEEAKELEVGQEIDLVVESLSLETKRLTLKLI